METFPNCGCSLVKKLESDVAAEKARFATLKEDFEYNLSLLAERDAELAAYDGRVEALRADVLERDKKLSELSVMVASSDKGMRDELARVSALEQQNVAQRDRFDQIVAKLRQEREKDQMLASEEIERLRRDAEFLRTNHDAAMESQRSEAATALSSAMERREHDLRVASDKFLEELRVLERKVRLLEAEVSDAGDKLARRERECEGLRNELAAEKGRAQTSEWTVADLKRAAEVKRKEEEEAREKIRSELRSAEDRGEKKASELVVTVRQLENTLTGMSEDFEKSRKEWRTREEERLAELERADQQRAGFEAKVCEMKLEHKRTVEQMRSENDRLRSEAGLLRSKMKERDADLATVVADKQGVSHQSERLVSGLRRELSRARKAARTWEEKCTAATRSLGEVRAAAEREAEVRIRNLTKVHMENLRRMAGENEVLRSNFELSESRRAKAVSQLQFKEQILSQRDDGPPDFLSLGTLDDDVSIPSFPSPSPQRAPINIPKDFAGPSGDSEEVERLRHENASIRQVVTAMRQELESLANGEENVVLERDQLRQELADLQDSDVARIRRERDRLVNVSNQLRADLSGVKKELTSRVVAMEEIVSQTRGSPGGQAEVPAPADEGLCSSVDAKNALLASVESDLNASSVEMLESEPEAGSEVTRTPHRVRKRTISDRVRQIKGDLLAVDGEKHSPRQRPRSVSTGKRPKSRKKLRPKAASRYQRPEWAPEKH